MHVVICMFASERIAKETKSWHVTRFCLCIKSYSHGPVPRFVFLIRGKRMCVVGITTALEYTTSVPRLDVWFDMQKSSFRSLFVLIIWLCVRNYCQIANLIQPQQTHLILHKITSTKTTLPPLTVEATPSSKHHSNLSSVARPYTPSERRKIESPRGPSPRPGSHW